MTHTIYGLRLRGEAEVRYVGQTRHCGGTRLAEHLAMSKCAPCKRPLARWLLENADDIEVVELGVATAEAGARLLERETIALLLRLDHRLFNLEHVPKARQIVDPGHVGRGQRSAAYLASRTRTPKSPTSPTPSVLGAGA